jgi:DNA-binding response OmpR family regulator
MCLKNMRILVIEDEALIAMMIEDTLQGVGAEVMGIAATVGDALSLIEEVSAAGGIDAAVLDVNLSGQVAVDVADALAERCIPFLFVTGYGGSYDRGRHIAAPILGKPFDASDLLAALDAATTPGGLARQANGCPVRPDAGLR